MEQEKKTKDMKDNKEPVATPAPRKEPKEPAKFIRYEEIESKVQAAKERGDVDEVLLLNELTLARNFQRNGLSKQDQKEFSVVHVIYTAFDENGNRQLVKRDGVYNTLVFENYGDAEDIVALENFDDDRVLIVPRDSIFVSEYIK